MRIVAVPAGTFASLVRERWHYAGRSHTFGAGTFAPLPDLLEALAPLGMPDVQYASRRHHSGGVTRRAATSAAVTWAHSTVINVAAVLLIHLAAIKYVFLPIGTL